MSSNHFEKEVNGLLNFVTLEGKRVSPAREEEAGLTLGCRESMIESRKPVLSDQAQGGCHHVPHSWTGNSILKSIIIPPVIL